jgi:4-diphosphocytidyl-2C-methyl-D-erythritol kinase
MVSPFLVPEPTRLLRAEKSFTTDVSGSGACAFSVMLTSREMAERAGARDASVRLSELVRDTMTLPIQVIQQS